MTVTAHPLSPAARAFDAIAPIFDERFGEWLSVSVQRRAVRRELARAFPRRSRLLELGGGTGDDTRWLVERGREVLMTDVSPAMVTVARQKLRDLPGPPPRVLDAANLMPLVRERDAESLPPFDGVFSNFAGLNCIDELGAIAPALSRLVRPGGRVVLVLFGTASPGEIVVQLVRRDPVAAFRRFHRGPVAARLGGQQFTVRYHSRGDVVRALGPWFLLEARRGIGVFVPPSAAEPWISRHPALLLLLERLDLIASRPLAALGDHVLYQLVRTGIAAAADPE
jgi:SAM-dependent methyltransferase